MLVTEVGNPMLASVQGSLVLLLVTEVGNPVLASVQGSLVLLLEVGPKGEESLSWFVLK